MMMPSLLLISLMQQPQTRTVQPKLPPVPVAGRIFRRSGADSVPQGATMVVLHRVGQDRQGPVDSVMSDGAGHFRITIHPDSGALYLLSARFRGIEYFAPPVSRDASNPDLDVKLVVYDTSSTVALTVASRHLVVGSADPSGVRNVADLVLLENSGTVTRLAGDSTHPIWSMRLPHQAEGIEIGESDFSSDALIIHGDTLSLTASVPPGKRSFTLTYRLPLGVSEFQVPIDQDVLEADVLSEEPQLKVSGGLLRGDTLSVVGRHFTKWEGTLNAGTPVLLSFPRSSRTSTWALPTLIGVLGLALLVLGAVSQRRNALLATALPSPRATAGNASEVDQLLDRIAALDTAHAGGPDAHSAESWTAYLAERARLKAELAALLPR